MQYIFELPPCFYKHWSSLRWLPDAFFVLLFSFLFLKTLFEMIEVVFKMALMAEKNIKAGKQKQGRGHFNIGIIILCIGNSLWYLYNTQSNLIGCSTLSQEFLKLIGWCWKIMRRQLWTLTCPIRSSMSKAREAADQIMVSLVALVSIYCAVLKTNYDKTSILKSAAMMAIRIHTCNFGWSRSWSVVGLHCMQ